MTTDLIIDLDDGSPPTVISRVERSKSTAPNVLKHTAPPVVEITSTPVALAISYATVRCLSCGTSHRDHRGLFLENRLSNGVRQLKRITLREAAAFKLLPRRIDEAPEEVLPICSNCGLIDKLFFDAIYAAEAQPGLFDSDGQSQPLATIVQKIAEEPTLDEGLENGGI